jgi:hypothetical protein
LFLKILLPNRAFALKTPNDALNIQQLPFKKCGTEAVQDFPLFLF